MEVEVVVVRVVLVVAAFVGVLLVFNQMGVFENGVYPPVMSF